MSIFQIQDKYLFPEPLGYAKWKWRILGKEYLGETAWYFERMSYFGWSDYRSHGTGVKQQILLYRGKI